MSLPSNTNSIRKNSIHLDEGIKDVRFITAASRPQFRSKHKSEGDELIHTNKTDDERFQSMYTDSKFQIPGTSLEEDKYGRKQKKKKEKKKKDGFFKKSSTPTDEEDDQMIQNNNKVGEEKEEDERFSTNQLSLREDNNTAKQQEKGELAKKMDPITLPKDAEARIAYLTALSRGEIDNSSATSSSFGDSDDLSSNSSCSGFSEADEEDAHDIMGPDDKEVDITYESSPYLAICNLDWRHVRAVDIFVILGSFCNSNDDVKSVKIFTSNFGKEQLEKEQIYGPPAGIFLKKKKKHSTENDSNDDDDDASTTASEVEPEYRSDDEEETETNVYKNFPHQASALENIDEEDVMDVEKLRAYERSKLKYYFAVAEFCNSDAADKVYKELDGMEFENSSASFDLRSLSKSQISSEINEEDMKDECYGIPYEYQPPRFVVEALQHTSVKCTWDETSDKERERKLTQFFGVNKDAWNAMVEGDDLKAYLASDASSSSDEDEGIKKKQKSSQLRKLLGLDNDDDDNNDDDNSNNQVNSSTSNSSDNEDEDSEEEEDEEKEAVVRIGEPDLASKIRSKIEQNRNEDQTTKVMTPWEKYQQKRKEKRKEKRQKRKDGNNNIVSTEDDGMYDQDPEFRHEEDDSSNEEDFFVEENEAVKEIEIHPSRPEVQKNSETKKTDDDTSAGAVHTSRTASTKEELELLLAGDDGK